MARVRLPQGLQIVEAPGHLQVADQSLEIVERKGLGHPDSICDGIAEAVAVALAREYRVRTGAIRHFNADKSLLVAGRARCEFGGGTVEEPMRLILGDRATTEVGGVLVPIEEIAVNAIRRWLTSHLPTISLGKHLVTDVALKPSSGELGGLLAGIAGEAVANDTSAAVGYAPFTPAERLVLDAERFLNSPSFKGAFPESGWDVKVMAVRTQARVRLTVAMPLLADRVASEADYFRKKATILDALRDHLECDIRRQGRRPLDLDLAFNTLDRPGLGASGTYLSVLGTSAEDGDSGQVGRGNRVNGLISLNRPAPAEAAAGKNPIIHPGKVYNVLSHALARRIHEEVAGAQEVYVWLCSRIGEPLGHPLVAAVQVSLAKGLRRSQVRGAIADLIAAGLADLPAFTEKLALGEYPVY